MLTVWLDSWQVQCCGKTFSVGGHVAWTLVSEPDLDYPESVLGQELAPSVTHREEHHGDLPDDAPTTSGTVRSIKAVFCRYGPGPDAKTLYPIKGSVTFADKLSADGWEQEAGDRRFVSYLVELDASE